MKRRIAFAVVACAAVLAAQHASQSGYSFQTIDVPYFTPGTQMDMQCLYLTDNGIVGAQYQHPPSGTCCGAPGSLDNDNTAFLLPDGIWTVIDVPGASSTGTSNPTNQGRIALSYKFANDVWQVAIWDRFILTPVLTPPGYPGGLFINGLNNSGMMAGGVTDAAGHSHGYIGESSHYTIVDYPGALDTTFSKMADNGVAVGYYDLADGTMHAFQYSKAGKFSTIDPPGASGVAVALSISNSGVIAGAYVDADGSLLGFLLEKGSFTDFVVPNAALTAPWSINESGQVAGIYAGSDGIYHGFTATPVHGNH